MRPFFGLLFLVLFFQNFAFANYSSMPKGCLKQSLHDGEICKVLSHDKVMVPWIKNKFYTSTKTLLEIQKDHIFLGYGYVWFHFDQPVEIRTPYGSVMPTGSGEVWVEVKNDHAMIRALGDNLLVTGKGSESSQLLVKGFEMKLGTVAYATGVAHQTIPTSISMEDHLQSLDRVFPYDDMDFKATVNQLAHVLTKASAQASQLHQKIVERKIASEKERMQKAEFNAELRSRLEKYFRRIYRQKNSLE